MRNLILLSCAVVLSACVTSAPCLEQPSVTPKSYPQDLESCARQPEQRWCVVECEINPERLWCQN